MNLPLTPAPRSVSTLPRRRVAASLFLGFLSALSFGVYLLVSWRVDGLGFPLDDAWIHQTYARNLARYGEWAFLAGQPSAGSTAPLWSGLLAIGHVFGLAPYLWTYLLGWLSLWGVAVLGESTFHRVAALSPPHLAASPRLPLAGLLLLCEWHLVWSAASGMETLPFALIVLLIFLLLYSSPSRPLSPSSSRPLSLGALIGLSVWLRPDGVTLLGAVGWVISMGKQEWREKLRIAGLTLAGFALLFLPYLWFNRFLSGGWWPNTFYAKQAEYAIHRTLPFLTRLIQQASLPLVGGGAILLPGFVLFLAGAARRRDWRALTAPLWAIGYLVLYAWRLPMTYQHGRYLIPAMPVFLLWGLAGLADWVRWHSPSFWRRVVSRAWLLSAGVGLLLFWGLGATAYARDVAVIESEMTATARWIAAKTEADALIAAHDIGALGYFGERAILDLAGLVSPQVIPFIREEDALRNHLNAAGADYLMTFPGWYPALTACVPLIFQSEGRFSPALGGENMAVYRWIPSADCVQK